MRDDLIEALGAIADGMRDAGEHEDAAILDRAAAALEAAREDATSPATSPATSTDQILIDAIEREIRQLEGKVGWLPQATRIANLRAAIDQARGKGWRNE